MTEWKDALHEGAAALGLTVTAEEEDRLSRFTALLLERNQQMNLTAITAPRDVALKHVVDSLSVELLWQPRPGEWAIDIGTGAGFPGIPLAIRHPAVHIVLNDSVRKKIDFLREAVTLLQLPNAHPEWARAEELGRHADFRGRFCTVFARAVSHLAMLCEYALPLLRDGGTLIAMKGPSGAEELRQSRRALAELGGAVADARRFSLPDVGERLLIAITKQRPTPRQYPRDAAVMKKRPLYLDSDRPTP
ncbi:MAG: 16S rRNA (guanine(527)-N(7))-methyltransferase RsmG [Armatimonadota bacterium]